MQLFNWPWEWCWHKITMLIHIYLYIESVCLIDCMLKVLLAPRNRHTHVEYEVHTFVFLSLYVFKHLIHILINFIKRKMNQVNHPYISMSNWQIWWKHLMRRDNPLSSNPDDLSTGSLFYLYFWIRFRPWQKSYLRQTAATVPLIKPVHIVKYSTMVWLDLIHAGYVIW